MDHVGILNNHNSNDLDIKNKVNNISRQRLSVVVTPGDYFWALCNSLETNTEKF